MNPEEEFNKFWAKNFGSQFYEPHRLEVEVMWMAAYRLGLTRAAEIADGHDHESEHDYCQGCGEYISEAILTERDKS